MGIEYEQAIKKKRKFKWPKYLKKNPFTLLYQGNKNLERLVQKKLKNGDRRDQRWSWRDEESWTT